jgi:uncharacterized radical SAM superfamily Fe-S cluster-containing enzyme
VKITRETQSLCPVCLRRLPAWHAAEGGDVYMEKECPEHGKFRTIIWRGGDDLPIESWRGDIPALSEALPCPDACGLCGRHLQETCCVLLEVTRRCDLRCRYCLAGDAAFPDPPIEEVRGWLSELAQAGRGFVYLSGGEPTLRDDLPEIVAFAKQSGIRYVQLNSNGLRLAEDMKYAEALAGAGLSFVFLQFDGTTEEIYQTLRGAPLYETKRRAVENCGKLGLGVTFACTVVPGVNDGNLGKLIRLAMSLSPSVRGVHFQPISYFGRYPEPPSDNMRVTLPELLREIRRQSGGMFTPEQFAPSRCDHPTCGFHGDFVIMPDGPRSLTRQIKGEPCCSAESAEKSRHFVGRRWERRSSCCGDNPSGSASHENAPPDLSSFDGFLDRVRSHGFTLSAMAFQDCYNIDLERLRRCSLHVYANGKTIPFCARYLTPRNA